MPGPRLTAHDRRVIARGLVAGLEFAEIARQLGRPTSTITREIARNGGPADYHADRAHRATVRRARRRPTSARPVPLAADAHGRDPAAVTSVVEELAGVMADGGVPRMPARVLSCLLVADDGWSTAAELAAQLRVSPASVSKAVAYLEGVGLLRREREDGGRRERYHVDDDMWTRAWTTSARAHTAWAQAARRGAEILGHTTPAGTRVGTMARFFAQLSEQMAGPDALGPVEATEDALTVIAALAQAGAPLTADALAPALGWRRTRVAQAFVDAERLAAHTDPVVVRRAGTSAYVLAASPHRLSDAQVDALTTRE